jgi:glycosyltransferase involved in cell wall biosynthesis
VVIAHEATRTGSPVVLVDLLSRARPQLHHPLAIRLLAQGPLADDLLRLGDTNPVGVRPGAVLVNSALGAASLFDYAEGVPAGVYVHEEGDALRNLPAADKRALAERADHVLAVSPGAHEGLVSLGVPAERITLMPPIVAIAAPPVALVETVRSELAPDEGSLLVVGCGVAGWRKGTDLFVDTGGRLAADPRVRLAWVGRRSRSFGRLLDADCRSVGLEGRITWCGEVEDSAPYLAAADAVLMTSREDPQPLVPLEAAVLGTPTACFDTGGLGRLGDAGAAEAVAYPDTVALAAATAALLDEPQRSREIVDRARATVQRVHSPETVVPQFIAFLDRLLGAGSTEAGPSGDPTP